MGIQVYTEAVLQSQVLPISHSRKFDHDTGSGLFTPVMLCACPVSVLIAQP